MKNFLVFGLFIFLQCVNASAQLVPEEQAMYDRMDRMERDLTLLQRKIYKAPQDEVVSVDYVAPIVPAEVKGGSLEHLYIKISELEQTIATLTSQVEELSHELSQTKQELQKTNLEMDVRFAEMEKKLSAQKTEPVTPAKTEDKKTDKKTTSENTMSAKEMYDAAYKLLDEQKYAQAQVAFEDFLAKYPQDTLSGNAQYWLGETFYVRQLYEPAAVAFANGFKTYKSSAKGPDCLFKLGMTMEKLNKTKEACTAFKNVKKEFPKAPEKLLTRSVKEIETLGCNK